MMVSPKSRQVSTYNSVAILIAAIGSLIYGYDSSIIATTLGQPSFYTYFNLSDDTSSPGYSYTSQITGACNGLAQAGGFFGCFLNASISERWGRRVSFQIASVLCLIGSSVQAGAQDLPTFLAFRFVNGLGVGMCLTATPLYQSELSPPHARGILVGTHGAFLAIGYNIAGWVGLGCYFAKSPQFSWRFPLALQVLFPLVLFIGSFWLPQSPRWLISRDRLDEARRVLQRLCPSDDPQHSQCSTQFTQIASHIRLEKNQYLKRHPGHSDITNLFVRDMKELFIHPPYRKRAFLGFTLMFGAQCTGVLVLNNYQVTLYPGLGISEVLSLGLYCVYLGIALLGNCACGPIVDHFGRRTSLLVGLGGCLIALIGECIAAHFASLPGASKSELSLAVFFIFLYIPIFSSLIDPNMYIYSSEIFPSEVRSVGIATSMSGQWLATICFLQSAPIAFDNIGYRFYIVFIVCTVVLGVLVYSFYPETKGLSLEEMAGIFGDEVARSLDDEGKQDYELAGKSENEASSMGIEDIGH